LVKLTREEKEKIKKLLNEAEAIGKVIDELKQEGYKNILVVDGYSNDGTLEIAKQKGAKAIYQHGKGKAGAIKQQ